MTRWAVYAAGIAISAAMLLYAFAGVYSAMSAPIEPQAIEVIDGDTIRVRGQTIRLIGFDTPEAGSRAQCERERTMAAAASRRLRQIVAGGGIDLKIVPCNCRPGTEGTLACNRGRACGALSASGHDVGARLIAEGLARPYVCSSSACPRRETWCG